MFELETDSEVGTGLGALLGLGTALEPEAVVGLGLVATTALEIGVGFGLELELVTEYGPAAAERPEFESGFVAGTEPEPVDGVGLGYGAAAEAEFGPETEPEAGTEPGVAAGPEAVAEPEVGFVAAFGMKFVPGGGTEVGPSVGSGPGLKPEPGARFLFGFETAPEVESEQEEVLALWVVAEIVAESVAVVETELGPVGDFEVVLGDALEPECVASAGPEPVHGFGLETGFEAEYGFGAEAEAEWVSWWSQQRRLVILSYEPALLRLAFEPPAARTRPQGAGLVLETEESEMLEAVE